jgi:N-acetylneuraminate lyase
VADLVAWCAAVAEAAPDVPFYYYHVPASSGVVFPMVEFLQAARDAVPTLAGMKFTSQDLMDLRLCTAVDGGQYNLLYGHEEMLLPGLLSGAQGSVSTGYNYAAPLYLRIYEAWAVGDLKTAQREQVRGAWLVHTLRSVGVHWKAVMKLVGIDCGPPRLPQRGWTAEDLRRLEAALDEIGFFEDCAGGGR